VAIPGFPLPLRNALAELALSAHDDEASRDALAWLAAERRSAPPASAAERLVALHLIDAGGDRVLAVHAPHEGAAAAHAMKALRAAEAFATMPVSTGIGRAVRRAAALWRERLFFEVHEVLEVVWQKATDDTRQALQGVIQIAVAYHHLAHGNLRGARSLLGEGRRRLASVPDETLELDLPALLSATEPWEAALGTGTQPVLDLPELRLRSAPSAP
jgi:hypothetical protein